MKVIRIHSYGGGVQSVTLLWKYLNGEFEKPDLVIFADTQSEPKSVYESLRRDMNACKDHGVEFIVVSQGNLERQVEDVSVYVPAFTLDKNGNKGMLHRQCTDRYKVKPIRRELRKRGVKRGEIWLGISTDEASRQKDSSVMWLRNRYPLIELGLSRKECQQYLDNIGVKASKSACIFCPYMNRSQWNSLDTEELDRAIKYDESLRKKRIDIGFLLFLHSSRTPISQALNTDGKDLNLFENECEGYCGI